MNSASKSNRLKVAIIGCGNIGVAHARGYAESGRTDLIGVVDPVRGRARDYADRFGPTNIYGSAADLLAGEQPDIVSVATPPGTHAELAIEALAAGSSVLLEKPPVLSLAELDAVAAAEARSDGNVYVVFQHRHGSGARRAHRLITGSQLGVPRVAICETLWFRPRSYFDPQWRGTWAGEGGGPTLGHGIHQTDLLLHLLGPWQSLNASAMRLDRPVEFEDVSMASVILENRSVASVVNSLLSPQELSRIRIDLTGGTLEVDHVYGYSDANWTFSPAPGDAQAAQLGVNPGADTSADGLSAAAGHDWWRASIGTDEPSNHRTQLTRLVDDLLAGRTHDTTLASTRPTMEFVTGLYASAVTGDPVDRSDLRPGHPFYEALHGNISKPELMDRFTI